MAPGSTRSTGALQQALQFRLEVEVTSQAVALKRFKLNENVYVAVLDIEVVAQGGTKNLKAPHAIESAQIGDLTTRIFNQWVHGGRLA
jgi:hypothetical protein